MGQGYPFLVTYEQEELFEAMSDVSETSYCAGWMTGNEDRVWQLTHTGGDYGMAHWNLDDREMERVRRASIAADCWIEWRDHEPRPVPLAQWAAEHPVSDDAPVIRWIWETEEGRASLARLGIDLPTTA